MKSWNLYTIIRMKNAMKNAMKNVTHSASLFCVFCLYSLGLLPPPAPHANNFVLLHYITEELKLMSNI